MLNGRTRLMAWPVRRRGLFEWPLRALYRRTAARYFDVCALVIVLNGVVVAGFGVVGLLFYVDLSVGEVALFGGCLAVAFAVESAVAALHFLRAAEPARAWLARDRAEDAAPAARSSAAQLPLVLVRRAKPLRDRGRRRGRRGPCPRRVARASGISSSAAVTDVLPAVHL